MPTVIVPISLTSELPEEPQPLTHCGNAIPHVAEELQVKFESNKLLPEIPTTGAPKERNPYKAVPPASEAETEKKERQKKKDEEQLAKERSRRTRKAARLVVIMAFISYKNSMPDGMASGVVSTTFGMPVLNAQGSYTMSPLAIAGCSLAVQSVTHAQCTRFYPSNQPLPPEGDYYDKVVPLPTMPPVIESYQKVEASISQSRPPTHSLLTRTEMREGKRRLLALATVLECDAVHFHFTPTCQFLKKWMDSSSLKAVLVVVIELMLQDEDITHTLLGITLWETIESLLDEYFYDFKELFMWDKCKCSEFFDQYKDIFFYGPIPEAPEKTFVALNSHIQDQHYSRKMSVLLDQQYKKKCNQKNFITMVHDLLRQYPDNHWTIDDLKNEWDCNVMNLRNEDGTLKFPLKCGDLSKLLQKEQKSFKLKKDSPVKGKTEVILRNA